MLPRRTQVHAAQAISSMARWAVRLSFAILVVVVAVVFTPSTGATGHFNSDAAIPLIMANSEKVDGFFLFFLAQDRFGAWPFLVANACHRLTGLFWRPDGLHLFVVAALVASVFPLAKIASVSASLLGVVMLGGVVMVPLLQQNALTLDQPYSWQWLALMWAWGAMRQIVESRSREGDGPGAWIGLVVASVAGFLACWISPLSIVLLIVFATVEVIRARAPNSGVTSPVSCGHLVPPILLSAVGLLLVALIHHRASRELGYQYQITSAKFDWLFLGQNFLHQWRSFVSVRGPCIAVIAVALGLSAVFRRSVGPRAPTLAVWCGLIASACAVGAINVVLAWPRLNGYAARYHTLTVLALVSAAAIILARLAERIPIWARGLACIAIALGGVVFTPASRTDPYFSSNRAAAEALQERAPRSVLLGEYWGLYRYVALQDRGALLPITVEFSVNRMPWTSRDFGRADSILVSHQNSTRFGDPAAPVPFIYEHGELFEKTTAAWLVVGDQAFSLFSQTRGRRMTDAAVELGGQPWQVRDDRFVPDGELPPGDLDLVVTLDGARPRWLVVGFGKPLAPEQGGSAGAVAIEGPEVAPVPALAGDRTLAWPWPDAAKTLRVGSLIQTTGPDIEAVFLVGDDA
ncbi:MAG: hypothetical protein JXR83_03020 [Deltaproteobacteria bacterium]|nr:hypothetical protein [Deltaproteobacteria bacterium]